MMNVNIDFVSEIWTQIKNKWLDNITLINAKSSVKFNTGIMALIWLLKELLELKRSLYRVDNNTFKLGKVAEEELVNNAQTFWVDKWLLEIIYRFIEVEIFRLEKINID